MFRIEIRAMARELDVSHTTIYRVINTPWVVAEDTRTKVIDALNQRGFYTRDQRPTPSVVFHYGNSAHTNYMREIGESLRQRLEPKELRIEECNYRLNRQDFVRKIETADTVVFFAELDDEGVRLTKEANPEIVIISLFGGELGDIVIRPDDYLGGKQAAELFHLRNYKHVLVAAPFSDSLSESSFIDRAKSFQAEFLWRQPAGKVELLDLPRDSESSLRLRIRRYFYRRKRLPEAVFSPNCFVADRIFDLLREQKLNIDLLGYDEPLPGNTTHVYDRIVFHKEEIIRRTEFFLQNRLVLNCHEPMRILVNTNLSLKS